VLPGDWHLNSYFEHGRNNDDLIARNFPRTDREFLAMDAVVDPATGAITCRVNLYQPGYGCVPIDLLGAGRATPAALDYVTAGTKTAYLVNTQDAFEAAVDGSLFKSWWQPGPWSLAFGVDYRRNKLTQNVADPTNPANDPTYVAVPKNNPAIGIQGIPSGFAGVNSGVQFSIQANFGGTVEVKEAFTELLVPLLKDKPFAKQLNASLSGRWASYTGSGSIWSYKYGLDWSTTDWLRFRGTLSRDVRAANMSERFNAAGAGASVRDPVFNNQTVIFSEIIGGNPSVNPEKADTYTVGFVLQPLKGLSISYDWYSIDIKDAIGRLGPQNIVSFCAAGAQQFCSLITRDPNTNVILGLKDVFLNINSQKIIGSDVEADYNFQFGGGRSLTARLLGGYLDRMAVANLGVPVQEQAGTVGNLNFPRVQVNANLQYSQGPYSVFVNERFISAGKRFYNDNSNPILGGVTINNDHVASVYYTDLNFAYTFGLSHESELQTYLNITNVLDRPPPRAASGPRLRRHDADQQQPVRHTRPALRGRSEVQLLMALRTAAGGCPRPSAFTERE
jgi:iron complex outermembrane recepter protein